MNKLMPTANCHWAEQYVGMPYVVDVFECAEMAQLVNREVFGREIRLPPERPHRGKGGYERYLAMTKQLAAVTDDYGVCTDEPKEGDGVVLLARGRPSHIGIYCRIAGEAWVLHCMSSAGQAILTRIRELHLRGLSVEGYYRWT